LISLHQTGKTPPPPYDLIDFHSIIKQPDYRASASMTSDTAPRRSCWLNV
jgi:hypothetical protein